VHRPGGGLATRSVFTWSLNGPHTPQAPVDKHGGAPSVAAAKESLVAALRAWAVWAGIRAPDGGGPVTPHWHLADEGDDVWLLMSGSFAVGRVLRPATGPRQDPHWMLTGARARGAAGAVRLGGENRDREVGAGQRVACMADVDGFRDDRAA
jgi:hypothetical protein